MINIPKDNVSTIRLYHVAMPHHAEKLTEEVFNYEQNKKYKLFHVVEIPDEECGEGEYEFHYQEGLPSELTLSLLKRQDKIHLKYYYVHHDDLDTVLSIARFQKPDPRSFFDVRSPFEVLYQFKLYPINDGDAADRTVVIDDVDFILMGEVVYVDGESIVSRFDLCTSDYQGEVTLRRNDKDKHFCHYYIQHDMGPIFVNAMNFSFEERNIPFGENTSNDQQPK
jgi:hypothetical protein